MSPSLSWLLTVCCFLLPSLSSRIQNSCELLRGWALNRVKQLKCVCRGGLLRSDLGSHASSYVNVHTSSELPTNLRPLICNQGRSVSHKIITVTQWAAWSLSSLSTEGISGRKTAFEGGAEHLFRLAFLKQWATALRSTNSGLYSTVGWWSRDV